MYNVVFLILIIIVYMILMLCEESIAENCTNDHIAVVDNGSK